MIKRWSFLVLSLLVLTACPVYGQIQNVVFSEDFDSLTLMDSVNERLGAGVLQTVDADAPNTNPLPNVYSPTGPAGWTVDRENFGFFDGTPGTTGDYSPSPTTGNTGVAGTGLTDYGVREWDGWNFVDKTFWSDAAGGQQRELFTNATGTVAVADPDEYFDRGNPDDPTNGGYYNTSMSTPEISVSGGSFYTLQFDSSWRDEAFDDDHGPGGLIDANNQAVEVVARYSNGSSQVVVGWDSENGGTVPFKDDTPNESVSGNIFVPNGVTSVRLEFNMANAGNDWWWAVDNIDLTELGGTSVFSEDFEGVPLGDSVNERIGNSRVTASASDPDSVPRPDSFTHQPPANWTVDNSGIPGGAAVNDDIGVFEFEGWSFMTQDFWTFADGQGRGDFTKCVNICAIADSDEFDDLNSGGAGGPLDTLLVTPQINIASIPAGELAVEFDSAWRDEGTQAAVVTAEFFDSSGLSIGTEEVLRWESDSASPFFHDDNTNESVFQAINNPSNAASVQLTFSYLNGVNNWFWAVDSVKVGGTGIGTGPSCNFDGDGDCDINDLDLLYAQLGGSEAMFDLNSDGTVDDADVGEWLTAASLADSQGRTFLRGDADLDGDVDGPNFTALANNFGNPGGWSDGNFVVDAVPGGGTVGGPDFTALALNFGFVSANAVPEPTSLGLSLAVFLVAYLRKRAK